MSKKTTIGLFILLTPIALLYYFSPPRNFIIHIDAKPRGVEEFYVEIASSRTNFHGRTVEYVAKQLVPPNQKIAILLDRKKLLWFGNVSAKIYHPEYFWKTEGASSNYFLPKSNISPIAWSDVLENSPHWELEYASYENRTDQYLAAKLTHRIINMSDVHYHISSMNNQFLDPYIPTIDANKLRKSIEVLDRIVQEFNVAMLEESNPYVGPNDWVEQHIDETHSALAEIQEKFD